MADTGKEKITVGPRTFLIKGTLGSGGFSIVKKGVDSETQKKVALKIMFVEPNPNDPTYQQTCHEIKIMRKLQYPSIIKLLGYDLHSNYKGKKCVILVQEIAPHCELFDYLMHSKKFGEKLVMYIMYSIFDAIDFMHSKKICHRDLKPENILLGKEFELKIADFGFTTYFYNEDQRRALKTELGTRGYMAPEIEKTRRYDEKVDIFALGVIMFICAAGFPPFRETNEKDWWFEKIATNQWKMFWAAHERKAKFSNLCKSLIQGMLCADPAKRFNIDQCQEHDFFKKNPVGAPMSKSEYQQDMKNRYSVVRRAIAQAADRTNRSFSPPKTGFFGADVLCGNQYRARMLSPDVKGLDDIASEIVKNLLSKSDAKTEKSVRASLEGEDAENVKNTFAYATKPSDIAPYLPEDIDIENVWSNLNDHKLNVVVNNEQKVVDMGTVEDYVKYDNVEMMEIADEDLDLLLNAHRVYFGFGTLVHMIEGYCENKGCDMTIEEHNAAVQVGFNLTEERKMPDGQVIKMEETLTLKFTLLKSPSGVVLKIERFGMHIFADQYGHYENDLFDATKLKNWFVKKK